MLEKCRDGRDLRVLLSGGFMTTATMSSDLSPALLEFIRTCIPSYRTAEVLLAIVAHPERAGRDFSPDEIVRIMRPVDITESAARSSLTVLTANGLLRQHADRFSYSPSPDLEPRTQELMRAYSERPVTLIRAIYRNEDRGIQSFADAFKLRKD